MPTTSRWGARDGRSNAAYGVLLSGEEESGDPGLVHHQRLPDARRGGESAGRARSGAQRPVGSGAAGAGQFQQGAVDKTIALLSLESPSPIAKQGSKWQLTAATLSEAFWERAERLTALRRDEQTQMQEYVELDFGEHMGFLIKALDGDPEGRQPPALPPLPTGVDRYWFVKRLPFCAAPTCRSNRGTSGPRRHAAVWCQGRIRPSTGRAGQSAVRLGRRGLGPPGSARQVHDGRFADELVTACASMVRGWNPQPAPTWVTCVPSLRHPDLVPDFARRLAAALDLPFHPVLEKTDDSAGAEDDGKQHAAGAQR